jgi:hypothetical protein
LCAPTHRSSRSSIGSGNKSRPARLPFAWRRSTRRKGRPTPTVGWRLGVREDGWSSSSNLGRQAGEIQRSAPLLLLRRCPVRYCPQGPGARGRRRRSIPAGSGPNIWRRFDCPNPALQPVQSLAPPAPGDTVPPRLRLGRPPRCSGGATPDHTRNLHPTWCRWSGFLRMPASATSAARMASAVGMCSG